MNDPIFWNLAFLYVAFCGPLVLLAGWMVAQWYDGRAERRYAKRARARRLARVRRW